MASYQGCSALESMVSDFSTDLSKAALYIARACGIETGGWAVFASKGFKHGASLKEQEKFGLDNTFEAAPVSGKIIDPTQPTIKNAIDSDGTLLIHLDSQDPPFSIKYVMDYLTENAETNKKHSCSHLGDRTIWQETCNPRARGFIVYKFNDSSQHAFIKWMQDHGIRHLNVVATAGGNISRILKFREWFEMGLMSSVPVEKL